MIRTRRVMMVAGVVALAIAAGKGAGGRVQVENSVILKSPGRVRWAQSRAAVAADGKLVLTTQELDERVTHSYGDVFEMMSGDAGKTWSEPRRIEALRRQPVGEGIERVIGDLCPVLHTKTGVILATGKVFGFVNGKEDPSAERLAYAVRKDGRWSGMKVMEMPGTDHSGAAILEPNSGCVQRVDLEGGEILLPVRYRRVAKGPYVTTVVRCAFDGETLKYVEHGTELTIDRDRGLYEPSLARFGGKFYLTMRADDSAFVAVSDDGAHFGEIKPWTFDDGTALGSYNSQAHWVTHGGELSLVYARRGLNNDRVFRHRAPLVLGRVNETKLCVVRESEQPVMPEEGLDLAGGFGVVDVGAETWVVSSEMNFPKERAEEGNRVLLARIEWGQK